MITLATGVGSGLHLLGVTSVLKAGGDYWTGASAKERELQYFALANNPNIMPNPDALCVAFQKGFIDPDICSYLLKAQGVVWGKQGKNELENVINSGWHGVTKLNWFQLPLVDAWRAYLAGFLTFEQLDAIKQVHIARGRNLDVYQDLLQERYSVQEVLVLMNRGEIAKDQADAELHKLGYYESKYRDNIIKLASAIPSPSDIISMEMKGAFDDNLVRTLGLSDEIERSPNFQLFMKKQGLGRNIYKDDAGGDLTLDWPLKFWQAHWQRISPGEAYAMFFRLRADRLDRFRNTFPNISPVNEADLTNLLRQNDIIPSYRDRLSAIQSSQIPIRQLRQVYNIGAMTEQELVEQHKDHGYIDKDITYLVSVYNQNKKDYQEQQENKRLGKEKNAYTSNLLNSLEIGGISATDATIAISSIWNDEDKAGWAVNAIEIKKRNAYLKTYLKSVRDEFFLGLWSPESARENLTTAGFSDLDATRWVDLWVRQLRMPRRLANTSTVLDWYKRFLIQRQDVLQRLHNLGWADGDILLWLAEADQEIGKNIARQQAVAARTEQQRIRAAEKLRKQDEAAARAASETFRRIYPLASIEVWWKFKLITDEQAISFMQGHGLTEDVILLHLEEWSTERDKASGPAKPPVA